jgi:chemosensory pili system protein ChpA (sensor histidine kinase/response regulator)
MNAASEFDLGPLTWVKGEIDLALTRAAEALGQYETGNDVMQLRFGRTHIHQVHGALSIVGLDGVTQLTESIEALLASLEEGRTQYGQEVSVTLASAISALRKYLDDLVAGEPNQPLRLLPAYDALSRSRGLGPASPADLFFPDLSLRPARREAPAAPMSAEQLRTLLKSERSRFQRGLLSWMKHTGQPDDALEQMRAALDNIEATQDSPSARTFWWAATAFAESLFGRSGEPDPETRQLLARIDTQIRRLVEGSRNVAERLMRDVLYAVACAPATQSMLVAEVQSLFGLQRLIPSASGDLVTTPPQEIALRRLRDTLAATEESWNKFCSGSSNAITAFEQHAQACASLANEIGHTDLKRLGQGFSALASWLAEDPKRHSDGVAMEVATAILLLQNAQENFYRLGTDFAQQVDLMVARLHACIAGRVLGSAEELPLLDEMTRRAQEKLLVGQVAREIQTNLAQVEQSLDAFFRNPEKGHDLGLLDAPLKQIAGALAMLGHFGAVNTVQSSSERIHSFARSGYVPEQADFEALAQQLSVLGFFVDSLQHGEADYETFVRRLEGGGVQAEEAGAIVPSLETQVEQHRHATRSLIEAIKESPEDGQLRDELKHSLQSLQQDASLVADQELGETTRAVLGALESGNIFEASFDAAVSGLAPSSPELAEPSAETLELAQATHEAIDAELLEIFLEEAREVLATIKSEAATLAANPNDIEALTTIRRSAHTLKGSGRMVGLTDFGEAAWGLEQTLNFWLRQEQTVTPDLLGLIGNADDLFSRWVEVLATGGGAIPAPSAMVAEAARLRGEAPAELPQPVAEPEPIVAMPELASAEIVETLALPPVIEIELPAAGVEEEAPALVFELPAGPEWVAAPEAALPPEAGATVEEISFAGLEETPAIEMVDLRPVEEMDLSAAFSDLDVPEAVELRSTAAETPIPQPVEETPVRAPTLYDVFCEEARGHLDTLVAAFAVLDQHPRAPTAFDMTRAAHTLGGIAATVGLMPLHHLAIALEHALLRRDTCGRPDSIEGLETTRQAIMTLQAMFDGLALQRAPEEQAQLIDALSDIFLPEAEPEHDLTPMAPEEEAAAPQEVVPTAEVRVPEALPLAPAQAASRLQDELDEQLLPVFLDEAQDQLHGLTEQLRLWREDPAGGAAPHAVARLLHTFKGNARMAGAMNLGEFTHVLESRVEEALRLGSANPALIDEIEAGCDTLAQAADRLGRGESALPTPELAQASGQYAATTVTLSAEQEHEGDIAAQLASVRVRADLIDRLVNEAGEMSIARARIEGEMRSLKVSLLDLTENVIRLRRQLREIEIQAEGQIQARVAQAHEGQAEFDPLELDRFTRFQELTRFMAESVNDVATVQQNLLKNLDDANAALLAQARMNRGLQQALMGVRMMPFASQSERLFRIVRQSAKELGKRANFDIVGGQVELDRSVLDKMMAPVEHMLRNAIAHGIEPREDRLAAGKSEVGEIALRLAQEGNEIIIAMSDDGRGLDQERIRARGEALGMLAPGQFADEAQLYDLIFQPGFSTAGEVSQIAGRGVGMDVVKTEVSELGGRIEIVSQLGRGTTFRLYLPLTLAVTQTLLLRAGSNTYAVPATMIEQVLEMKEGPLAEVRERGDVEWQGNRYPFHFLPHLLGDAGAVPEAQRQYWLLLLRSGSQRVAVQVDELLGNQEVVVKNIGAQLARVVGVAGATVLGDGQVVLILNPVGLASRAPVVSVPSAVPAAPEAQAAPAAALPTVMVVDDSLTVRKITGRLLAREGYQVMLAKDGIDALEQLLEARPDVILSDIEMPRMDGFDLVRNIRADKQLKRIPVIMITSRTAEKHRNYAIEIGASNYLGKPYDEDELLSLISGYITRRATAGA